MEPAHSQITRLLSRDPNHKAALEKFSSERDELNVPLRIDYSNQSSDSYDMSRLEMNVRKELASMKSGTRTAKYEQIKTVLAHVGELKERTQDESYRFRLDALHLMPLDPIKTPAPLIADVAFDLGKILKKLSPPISGTPGPCDLAVASFMKVIAVAEERAQHLSKDHYVAMSSNIYQQVTPSYTKLKLNLEPSSLVVPLTNEARVCPLCNHTSAMAVMTASELKQHNLDNAEKFDKKMKEWQALHIEHGRPRRAGDMAPISTPFVCQCVHLKCTNPPNPSCSCSICSCQCNYQFHEEDVNGKRKHRRRDTAVGTQFNMQQATHQAANAMIDLGEQVAKRKRAWFEASAARDALVLSKEHILDATEKELRQLKPDEEGTHKSERLKARIDRLSRELKLLEKEELNGQDAPDAEDMHAHAI
mmetsp:Transcript_9668/g.11706  ORF Transcript_9668/g.11706 Transcript_9668/m.11706 type:complete len:420 (+) Transcript_9668:33-1292(+)